MNEKHIIDKRVIGIYDTGDIDDITEKEEAKEKAQKEAIEKQYSKKLEKAETTRMYGGFYFMREHKLLKDMDTQHITRLAYTCTYLNFDNLLVHDNGKKIDKEGLLKLLGLSKKAFYEFYNTMVLKGIFIEVVGKNDEVENIKILRDVATKGNLKSKKPYIRVYDEAIRHLYKSIRPTQHKQLGILFKFIDKINFQYNILCHNPEEKDKKLVDPLTIEDMAKHLGLTYEGVKNIRSALKKLKTKDNKYLIALVTVGRHTKVIINPSVMYRGNYAKSIEIYELFFNNPK